MNKKQRQILHCNKLNEIFANDMYPNGTHSITLPIPNPRSCGDRLENAIWIVKNLRFIWYRSGDLQAAVLDPLQEAKAPCNHIYQELALELIKAMRTHTIY